MKRRTVCLYLNSSLVDEARKAAEARGASLSELAEEAISLYLQLFDQLRTPRTPRRAAKGRPAAEAPTARPPQPSAPSPSLSTTPPPAAPPPSPTPPAPQLPPSAPQHLQNNAWIAVLRSRR